MEATKHTKPFDLAAAKAGAPYACRNGEEATILKWDSRQGSYPLHGVIGAIDVPMSWTTRGTYYTSREDYDYDLVMIPLGCIDGRPVFVGDELVDPIGATFVPGPADTGRLAGCRWPAPEKQYPVTRMNHGELYTAYKNGRDNGDVIWNYGGCKAVANAALRHAIDSGQVVAQVDPPAPMPRIFYELDDGTIVRGVAEAHEAGKKRSTARDMAIAEAVREVARTAAAIAQVELRLRVIESLDLADIISEVRP